jgi:hypothetical protein
MTSVETATTNATRTCSTQRIAAISVWVTQKNKYEKAAMRRYLMPSAIAASLSEKIRNTPYGDTNTAKLISPPTSKHTFMQMDTTSLMLFVSLLPQYCAASRDIDAEMPNISIKIILYT